MHAIDEFLVDSWGSIGCASGLAGHVSDWMHITESRDGLIRRFWGHLGALTWSFYPHPAQLRRHPKVLQQNHPKCHNQRCVPQLTSCRGRQLDNAYDPCPQLATWLPEDRRHPAFRNHRHKPTSHWFNGDSSSRQWRRQKVAIVLGYASVLSVVCFGRKLICGAVAILMEGWYSLPHDWRRAPVLL